MIKDLNLHGDQVAVCNAQVCVIGAGTAGIFLAQQLRKHGLQVVLLEAGNGDAHTPEELDQRCEQKGMHYRGAESGRSFGLGGTTVLWGGQMLPLAQADFESRPEVGFEAWPIAYGDLAAYWPVVRRDLGLPVAADTTDFVDTDLLRRKYPELHTLGGDFDLRLSEWLQFKTRNFAMAFENVLKDDTGLSVWVNASVIGLTRSTSTMHPQIDAISAQSANGRRLTVRASYVVICAGALESTRLLLEFDEATEGSITRSGAPLGRYFADHLSITCGQLECRDWRRFNLAVAPIFERGTMRTPRLELSAVAQKCMGLTSAFAHFTFTTHGDTGFDVVRSILRKRQGEHHNIDLSAMMLARVAKDMSAMAFWRWMYRRLWIPRQAELLLQVDIEQTPNPDSRLYLSRDRDSLNRKRLVIDWQIKAEDVRVIRKVAELIASMWQKSRLRDAADLRLTLPEQFDTFESLYDVYHPTGSIRMGSSAANSIVDKDLRLWATDNCYVSTTAVFPSAGSANPGYTHLALTARLAAHLEKRIAHDANL